LEKIRRRAGKIVSFRLDISPFIWHKVEEMLHLPNDPLPITLIILNESKRGADCSGF
jgi:hypothetical protein